MTICDKWEDGYPNQLSLRDFIYGQRLFAYKCKYIKDLQCIKVIKEIKQNIIVYMKKHAKLDNKSEKLLKFR